MSNTYKVLGFYLLTILCSCVKKKPEVIKPEINISSDKVYILNEGLFNQNNSSVTLLEPPTKVEQSVFRRINGRGLGDTGNDIAIYGQKVFMVISGSSQLEVADASSCRSLKQVPLFYKGIPMQPRKLAFWKNYVFVSCFDGHVVVMDTTTLNPFKYLEAGRNPEGMAVSEDKLFVSNSGGLDFPDYDNTVTVFDLHTWSEISTIWVGNNPGELLADGNGKVFVIVRGNPESDESFIKEISSVSFLVTDSIMINASGIKMKGDSLLVKNYSYVDNSSTIAVYSISTGLVINTNFINGSDFQILYGMGLNINTGDIYCSDAKDFASKGKVRVYDFRGNFKKEFEAGVNPGHFAFYDRH